MASSPIPPWGRARVPPGTPANASGSHRPPRRAPRVLTGAAQARPLILLVSQQPAPHEWPESHGGRAYRNPCWGSPVPWSAGTRTCEAPSSRTESSSYSYGLRGALPPTTGGHKPDYEPSGAYSCDCDGHPAGFATLVRPAALDGLHMFRGDGVRHRCPLNGKLLPL
jgi:hypothetical protein